MTPPIITLPPLGLYVHFPWCVRKCPYCDFNSHERSGELPQREYIDQLIADLQHELSLVPDGRLIETVFIGGGTPSLISGDGIARLLDALRATGRLGSSAEITLEANPGTVERRYFADYVAAGVNRISLGVQSFDPAQLQTLGRIHNTEDVHRAWDILVGLPLQKRNIDLMHGLPEQTVEQAMADIDAALALAPGHISWYQLTLEPNTRFYRYPPELPDEDALTDIEQAGHARLAAAGYRQYEISAFARPDQTCEHNRLYWNFGDYLGIGAGAHGKVTTTDTIVRTQRTRQPEHYLAAIDFGRRHQVVQARDLPFEYMLNVLRLRAGAPHDQFEARTGLPLTGIQPAVDRLIQKGVLHPDRHQLTERGWWFYNDAVAEFLPSE